MSDAILSSPFAPSSAASLLDGCRNLEAALAAEAAALFGADPLADAIRSAQRRKFDVALGRAGGVVRDALALELVTSILSGLPYQVSPYVHPHNPPLPPKLSRWSLSLAQMPSQERAVLARRHDAAERAEVIRRICFGTAPCSIFFSLAQTSARQRAFKSTASSWPRTIGPSRKAVPLFI
jgi:hypothetical protein